MAKSLQSMRIATVLYQSLAVDESNIMQSCSHLQLGWDWVPCWSIIESENQ